MYLKIYIDSGVEHMWNALSAACELFGELALYVSVQFKFDYPAHYDNRMTAYLKWVRQLSKKDKLFI